LYEPQLGGSALNDPIDVAVGQPLAPEDPQAFDAIGI